MEQEAGLLISARSVRVMLKTHRCKMLQPVISLVGALLLVAALSIVAAGSQASTGAVSLRTLTANADLIIYATVGALVVEEPPLQPDPNGEMQVRTLYRVRANITVLETIKGQAPNSGVVVTSAVGMEDSPVFHPGEHVILFLISNDDHETHSTVALAQGKFDVSDGQVLRADLPIQDFLNQICSYLTDQ